jgi:hypothetical protein
MMGEILLSGAVSVVCFAVYGWILVKGHPILRISASLAVIAIVSIFVSNFVRISERNRVCDQFGRPLNDILYTVDLNLRDGDYAIARRMLAELDSHMVWNGIQGNPEFHHFYTRVLKDDWATTTDQPVGTNESTD